MTVHVIGAGLAGLAAATRLAATGCAVTLHEQVRHAGGRCRSFADRKLGRRLDCGIHLAFAGRYQHLNRYLAEIGAPDALVGPTRAACRFVDTRRGEEWWLSPNAGRLPWWILAPWRRIPGTGLADYLALGRLALAGPGATVGEVMPHRGLGRERFWEPACVASLNTAPAGAQARALWNALREPLTAGEAPYRPRFVRHDLTTDLVAPALRHLDRTGATMRFGHRLLGVEFDGSRVAALIFSDGRSALAAGDAAILAVPPEAARRLLPGLAPPRTSSAIVTAHFKLQGAIAQGPEITGLIDESSMWLLTRDDLASVTVGAASALLALPSHALAHRLWRAAAAALDRDPASLPPHRLLRARQGTFAHTPAEYARRPPTRNGWSNLFLAGDWISTGQPATLDGAVQSGHAAAAAITGMSP